MEQNTEQTAPTAVMGSAKTLPGVMDLIYKSKDLVMKRPGFFFTLAAIPAILMLVGTLAAIFIPGLGAILAVVLVIASIVLNFYTLIAMVKGFDDDTINDWKKALGMAKGNFWAFVWAAIIISIVVFIGFLLLFIPGLYLSIVYGLYVFTFVLDGARGFDAAKQSKELVSGFWWAVFGRWLAFGLLVMIIFGVLTGIISAIGSETVSALFSTVIQVLITPFATAFTYFIYKGLKEIKQGSAKNEKPAMKEESEPMPAV